MHDKVRINGSTYSVNYKQSIGIGGEAVVVKLAVPQGGRSGKVTKALKLLKTPDYPEFTGRPAEQEQARQLIRLHQQKLPAFPTGLPSHIVVPEALAFDLQERTIVGYLMQYLENAELFIRYTQKSFRDQGVKTEQVLMMLTTLWQTLHGVHQKGVVIGDLSELNVLVTKHTEPWLIDADSFGYGQWPPMAYTKRFVDPLLCNQQPGVTTLELVKPQNKESDWRIFTMLLMMCLLYMDPYAGVFDPDKPTEYVPDELRPLRHITIFDDRVIYPADLPHYSILPDELLDFFHGMFVRDWRGIFPASLLENLHETTCTKCRKTHFRSVCPYCNQPARAAVRRRVFTTRKVHATEVLQTSGIVLSAALHHGVCRYLYHEHGQYKRGMFRVRHGGVTERRSDIPVFTTSLNPLRRHRISSESTLIAQNGQLVVIKPDGSQDRVDVDSYGSLPLIDANADHFYWVENGELFRDGDKVGGLVLAPKRLGTVLADQTLFWVGKKFGFGFYRIGNYQVGFVFNAELPGINDTVALPAIKGQLIDSTCVFSDERCWFFTTTRIGGITTNQCVVIGPNGHIESTELATSGSKGWLGSIRGKTAITLPDASGSSVRHLLFSPSSNGIVQLELRSGKVEIVAEYPETAQFVDTSTYLQIGPEGIYAAKDHSIFLLQLTN